MDNFFIEESQIDHTKFIQDFKCLIGEFENCIFEGVLFHEMNLSHYKFIDCIFRNCDFSNGNFKSSVFRNPQFVDCKLLGINWTYVKNFGVLNFNRCQLDFSNFQQMNLSKSKFQECSMKEVDFDESVLIETDFKQSDLSSANFNKANLKNADLRNCLNLSLDLSATTLKGARLSSSAAISLLEQQGMIVE